MGLLWILFFIWAQLVFKHHHQFMFIITHISTMGGMEISSLCNPTSLISSSFFTKYFPNSSKRTVISCSASPISIETIEEKIESNLLTRRRLILLRHAKSSWEDRSLKDHDRPLSKAGRVDAIDVSRKLQQLGWLPQLILSSNATRTKETLKIMQEEVRGLLEAEVHFVSSFYSVAAMDGQTAEHLQRAICQYSRDEILTVMCMGHNRGWEEAASMFSGSSVELKTCNAALLEATGNSWEEAFTSAGLGGWKLHGIVKPN